MAGGNRKTTMAKLNRERRLRERRLDKQSKKDARKHASAHQQEPAAEPSSAGDDQATLAGSGEEPVLEPVVQSRSDI
jgi:hypothetical protein